MFSNSVSTKIPNCRIFSGGCAAYGISDSDGIATVNQSGDDQFKSHKLKQFLRTSDVVQLLFGGMT